MWTRNPNIPADIQPAVFCAMVREVGAEATELLNDYVETIDSHYDRLVVLESLACSHDEEFINEYVLYFMTFTPNHYIPCCEIKSIDTFVNCL